MNCAEHPASYAIGICASCGRGICTDCMAEVANRVTCGRDYCNETAITTSAIMDGSKGHRTGTGLMVLFYTVFSILSLASAIGALILDRPVEAAITFPIALVFGLLGIHGFRSLKKMKRKT